MENLMERLFRKSKEATSTVQEPSFEDLCNALSSEKQEEFRQLVKELSGEGGMQMSKIEGNHDDLAPEQRKFNDLLSEANKEYYGVGSE